MFNSDLSRLTPLDFRRTAAAQFRLLKALCFGTNSAIDFFLQASPDHSLISTTVPSRQTINSQSDGIVRNINALVQASFLSNRGLEILMMMIVQARVISAVNTNAFHLSVPGSDQYETISNFYPRYDNASYDNVSYFNSF